MTSTEILQHDSPANETVLKVDLERNVHALRPGRGSRKDYAQLSRWFEIALNNMGRGLSMFDSAQRLIVCNKRYREIFSLPEALTQPGTAFADIVRYHVKSETGSETPQEIENERKWINHHVAEHAARQVLLQHAPPQRRPHHPR